MLTEKPIPAIAETAGTTAIALDFETASAAPGAVCSVGLAWISSAGRVTHKAHRLVRPRDMRFAPMNIAIHGIKPHDVEHERSEARRVGKEWVSTCRSRWSRSHEKQKITRTQIKQ